MAFPLDFLTGNYWVSCRGPVGFTLGAYWVSYWAFFRILVGAFCFFLFVPLGYPCWVKIEFQLDFLLDFQLDAYGVSHRVPTGFSSWSLIGFPIGFPSGFLLGLLLGSLVGACWISFRFPIGLLSGFLLESLLGSLLAFLLGSTFGAYLVSYWLPIRFPYRFLFCVAYGVSFCVSIGFPVGFLLRSHWFSIGFPTGCPLGFLLVSCCVSHWLHIGVSYRVPIRFPIGFLSGFRWNVVCSLYLVLHVSCSLHVSAFSFCFFAFSTLRPYFLVLNLYSFFAYFDLVSRFVCKEHDVWGLRRCHVPLIECRLLWSIWGSMFMTFYVLSFKHRLLLKEIRVMMAKSSLQRFEFFEAWKDDL